MKNGKKRRYLFQETEDVSELRVDACGDARRRGERLYTGGDGSEWWGVVTVEVIRLCDSKGARPCTTARPGEARPGMLNAQGTR